MSKLKDRPYKVLIVDDDVKYVEALNREAQGKRILLEHVTSLEEAKELLNTQKLKSITAIILDVLCMQKKNQEVPSADFLMAAFEYFRLNVPYVPIVILTGEPDRYKNLKELFRSTHSVYS